MNKAVKKAWIDALRSGEFKRGLYQLRDLDDHYDPIGVLMELAVRAKVIAEPVLFDGKTNGIGIFYGWVYDDSSVRLTKTVGEWSGLGYWNANHVLNISDKGASFDKTADYIEETY